MSYIGNSPGVASQRVETAFTATSNQTAFTPSSGYTLGYCDVYQNGVKLVNGDDYTASDGATVTLATGAATGDSIVIVASFPRGLSDGYLKSEADAKYALIASPTFTGVATFAKGTSNGITIGDVSTNSNSVLRLHGTSAGRNWQIANNLNVAGIEFTPSTADGGTTYTTPTVSFLSNGNVGIGTSSPGVRLDVVGAGGVLSGTARYVARILQDQTTYRGVALGYDTSGQIGIIYPESAGAASNLAFWTYSGSAWAERARIDSSGVFSVTKGSSVLAVFGDTSNSTDKYIRIGNSLGNFEFGTSASGHYLYGVGSLPLTFWTNSAERLRLGSTGSLTLDPNGNGASYLQLNTSSGGDGHILLQRGGVNRWQITSGGTHALQVYNYSIGSESVRVTSSGFTKMSDSGTYYASTGGYHEMSASTNANNGFIYRHTSATSPYGPWFYFTGASPNNTTNYFLVGSDTTNDKFYIYSNGTFGSRTSTYGGISDIKVKQDIVDAGSQWSDIKSLRFRKYRFKDNPTGPLQLGLISQEAELVSPGLVFETPDTERDEDGNMTETGEVTKSVKYSILYMKAVVALQEAMNRIEQLEADVATLKGTP